MAVSLALVEGAVTFAAAYVIAVAGGPPPAGAATGALGAASLMSLCCVAAFYYSDLYDDRAMADVRWLAPRVVKAGAVVLVLLAAASVAMPTARVPHGPLIATAAALALLLGVRAIAWTVSATLGRERVLVLGTGPLAQAILRALHTRGRARCAVLPMDDGAASRGREHRAASSAEALQEAVDRLRPTRVIVALRERRGRLAVDALLELRARGIAVEDAVDAYERLTGKLAIEAMTPSALLFSPGFRHSRLHRALGRAVSLVVAVAGVAVLGLIVGVVAIAIKLDSPGPVFFRQARVGIHGRRFTLIKFRTMTASDGPASEWLRDNGHRVTRVGRWLRMFRLDELPQFLSVLRGDMNLVGPRPHPVSNVALFSERIPYYSLRAVVRPGLTGWAQVRYGYANNLEEETEKMRYDLYYIKHLSIWLDLRILLDTVKVVLFGLGARAAQPALSFGAGGARAIARGTRDAA